MPLAGTRTVPTSDDMETFGRELGGVLRAGDLVVLTGPLGAGKTTLTRGIGEALNVRGPVTSPTFVLARTHPSLHDGPPLVHVDAYRLGSALELDDLDIDFARSVVVVEWGSGMLDGVAESWLDVEIARPTGAGGAVEVPDASAQSGADAGGPDVDALDSDALAADSADAGDTDVDDPDADDTDADAAPEEPRTVRVTPHGARWNTIAP